jgi:hypothetical protein
MASNGTNQDSLRTILHSIKMITPSYGFNLLQVSKSQKHFFFNYSSNCCSISHALNCLLHNMKRHYHVQRSFPHLPIRGQTNSVHISHTFYIILTFSKSSEVVTANWYIFLISLTWPIITRMPEMTTLIQRKLRSISNTTDIRNHPQNLRPKKIKGSIRSQENIFSLGHKNPQNKII